MWFSKRISVVVLFFCLSCSASDTEIKTIKFWAMGAEGEFVAQLVPEFEKNNPNIRVIVQQVPWTAAQEKLITAFVSDKLPDIFQLGNTWIPQFNSIFALEPLDEYVDSSLEINKANYFEGIWETNVLDSQVYGIPWYVDTRILFYRIDILERAGYNHPPKTWDELLDVSRKIKYLQNDKNKYAIYLPTNEWAPFIIFAMQIGAELLKDNYSYGNFSSDEFRTAFKFLTQFHQEKLAPRGFSQVTNVYQAFKEEYFAMYISGPWNIKEFEKQMSDSLEHMWSTAPLPSPDSNYPGLSLAGGSSLVINKKSDSKYESWKLIEFLSRKETQIKFYKLLNDLPANRESWKDSLFANNKHIQAFFKQFKNVKATPKIAEWEQIVFSKVQLYAEYVVREAMTVDEALKALDKDVNKILEKRRWIIEKGE